MAGQPHTTIHSTDFRSVELLLNNVSLTPGHAGKLVLLPLTERCRVLFGFGDRSPDCHSYDCDSRC